MKLRSGHIDESTKKLLLMTYLAKELTLLDATIKGKLYRRSTLFDEEELDKETQNQIDFLIRYDEDLRGETSGIPCIDVDFGAEPERREALLKQDLQRGGSDFYKDIVDSIAWKYSIKLSDEENKSLQKQVLNYAIKLARAEKEARRSADWSYIDSLKSDFDKQKAEIYEAYDQKYRLCDVVDDYLAQYDEPDCKVLLNSFRAVKRETDFILKTFGKNAELSFFNSKEAVVKLQNALKKKTKSNGEPLADKTRSSYLKRLSSLTNHVIDSAELQAINRIKGTYVSVGTEKSRDSYDANDMKCLEEALCTVPMDFGKGREPRNDRFWIILIAFLHGCRRGVNIDLKEGSIITDAASKLICFDFGRDSGANNKTAVTCPIHPLLHRIGFLEWFDKTRTGDKDRKLFEDDPDSFGQWWNGVDAEHSWNRLHVTKNPKVTFHSFRHYFCTWTDELAISEKLKNEMSGHVDRFVGDTVRTRHYLGRTRAKRMREVQTQSIEPDKILMTDVDWERLEERAKELFKL